MNKSDIEWVDYIWNPLSGCKEHCDFCFGRKRTSSFNGDKRWNVMNGNYSYIGEVKVLDEPFLSPNGAKLNNPFGYEPTFFRCRLDTPERWKMTRRILVCGYGELFGPWVPTEIIEEIFEACKKYPKHHFLFLTRFPDRYAELDQQGKLPENRNFWYGYSLPEIEGMPFMSIKHNTFAVMEPVISGCHVPKVDWLLIGAEVGSMKLPPPELAD